MNARQTLNRADSFIFDFDGTLAPNLDLPDMRRQVIALTDKHGVPRREFEQLFIVEIIEAAAHWLQGRDPGVARRYHNTAHQLITDFELAAAANTQPFQGVRETLAQLMATGKRLGVVTRNCNRAVRMVFGDIDDYFATVLARDNSEHLKPDLRHVTRALDELGSGAARSVMVGDGQMDMQIGKALGMVCVGVLSGSSDRPRLEESGADLVIDNVRSLTGLLS